MLSIQIILNFADTINTTFKDAPKVNVYNFACSDGSETYSLAMALKYALREDESKKYFPIKGYDLMSDMVEVAKSGKIPCDYNASVTIKKELCTSQDNPFVIRESKGVNDNYNMNFYPNEDIKSCVEFNQGDFTKMISEIEPKNSLIFCRNMWPYLYNQKVDVEKIIQDLYKQIDSSSRVVIGNFDLSSRFEFQRIFHLYFEEDSYNRYIYKKRDLNSLSNCMKLINTKISSKFTNFVEEIKKSSC